MGGQLEVTQKRVGNVSPMYAIEPATLVSALRSLKWTAMLKSVKCA